MECLHALAAAGLPGRLRRDDRAARAEPGDAGGGLALPAISRPGHDRRRALPPPPRDAVGRGGRRDAGVGAAFRGVPALALPGGPDSRRPRRWGRSIPRAVQRALQAGANVMMPNCTPTRVSGDGTNSTPARLSTGEAAAECRTKAEGMVTRGWAELLATGYGHSLRSRSRMKVRGTALQSRMTGKMRTEHDLLGEREVPAEAYWGIHTLRAVENFPRLRPALASGVDSRAGAREEGGGADESQGGAALGGEGGRDRRRPAMRCAAGQVRGSVPGGRASGGRGHFAQHEHERGAGQSRDASCSAARKGDYHLVHPNDDVNLSQSTNDVYPDRGEGGRDHAAAAR